ncbi:MAG TPA: cytochrome c biogenesis protein ResB [Candidatus Limnocylindrales bacterium]|nr:cytochrome c biogenesis protein ResB [Candidatus Limnocylindrales bacterium]
MALARLGAAAWRLLTDVRFAVVLITLLALAGLVGMLVRQFPVTVADDPARYAVEVAAMHRAWDGMAPLGLSVGSFLVDAFDALGLFGVFSTPWFLLLMTVLTISIVCCTLDRTPRLWRMANDVHVAQPEAFFDPSRGQRARIETAPTVATDSSATLVSAVQGALRARRFRRQRVERVDAVTFVYGDRNQFQKLATLLTHAGLVLFLLGGAVTVAAGFETVVFVGEGQTAPVRPIGTPGNLLVKNHDFLAPRRADGSFADFSTDLSVFRDGQEVARKTIRVNDPLTVDGFVFHQNTFGPAAELAIHDASGELVWSGPLLLDDVLLGRPQGFMTIPGAEVGLVAILSEGADGAPQLVMQGIGPGDPASGASETLFLVTIPVGVTTDPEVTAGHSIGWTGVSAWTGMVVKNDPGQPVIWLAFGLLIAGLVLTFWFPRRRAWARIESDGVSLAFLADRYVDRDGEFERLREAVQAATGHGRPA